MVGRSRRARSQRGAAAVEFALVLPVLLLVVFAVINFGFVMAQKASLANTARGAARYATVNAYSGTTHTCQSVVDKARDGARTVGIGDSNKVRVGVVVKLTNGSSGTTSTVCTGTAGTATATGSPSQLPCYNAAGTPATPDTLTVETSFTSSLLVPTPGLGSSVAVGGSSAFLCEYYK